MPAGGRRRRRAADRPGSPPQFSVNSGNGGLNNETAFGGLLTQFDNQVDDQLPDVFP